MRSLARGGGTHRAVTAKELVKGDAMSEVDLTPMALIPNVGVEGATDHRFASAREFFPLRLLKKACFLFRTERLSPGVGGCADLGDMDF